MRSVRLESPGPTHVGTTLTDTETGEKLHGIRWLRATIALDRVSVIEAEFIAAIATVEGRLEARFVDPVTGEWKEVAKISFADGTEWMA